MMQDGICPKCAAAQVHVYKNTAGELSIGLSFLGAASLVYYICTNCGFVEMFVEDKAKLPRIAEKYPKIRAKS